MKVQMGSNEVNTLKKVLSSVNQMVESFKIEK